MGREVTGSLAGQPWIGHSTNLVGLPTEFLASRDFNDEPMPLRISGVREFNRPLFDMLAEAESLPEAAQAFTLYMNAMFGIDPEQKEEPPPGKPRRFRSSYLKLIRGWGFDSNGAGGRGDEGLGGKPLRPAADLPQAADPAHLQRGLDELCRRENVKPLP